MKTKNLTKGLRIVLMVCLIAALFYSEVFAWSGSFRIGDKVRRDSHSYRRDCNRRWGSDFFGLQLFFAPKASDIVVKVPVECKAVTVPDNAVTICVPNSNGSYTPITLVRYGSGYLGPQGEYYAGNPTIAQLKMLYGR